MWQVRPWPLTHPSLTTPRPLFPEGNPVCGSHDPGQWPLSPSSCTHSSLYPHPPHVHKLLSLFSPPPMPSTPSCIFFTSSHCLSLSLSFSAYPHISGSEADATQALTYPISALVLNSPQASIQWYVAGHAHQTPGLRVNWETGCVTGRQLDCCTRLQGWLSSGSGVFIGLRKEEMYSLNGWIYCVWNAALRLLVDKLLKQAELCSCNVIEILCFCQFGFGMEVSLMRRFIFFHYKLQLCSKPSHPHIT